ncbi:winged helix DNA-binding domain-containing protein [Gigaspora margarita]|uniref:Winged helix DNA-binding domain-containing protein n=1 Tax=Gigaspora margarita TaxID=4874 RepID=A0A8H4AN55_GIGMA|nr:winged helix DNA-binding domain-containing protein [Gigaspora margarita]
MSRNHYSGNASQQQSYSIPPINIGSNSPPLSTATSIISITSRSRYEQQEPYQLLHTSPKMTTHPTLPPISALSCDFLPPLLSSSQQGNIHYRNQPNVERHEPSRYMSGGGNGGGLLSLNSQSAPSTPFHSSPYPTYLASPLPTQPPPIPQQTYYQPQQQQRSPPTSYYPQQNNYSTNYPSAYQRQSTPPPPPPPQVQTTSRRQQHQQHHHHPSSHYSPYNNMPQISPQNTHSHPSFTQPSQPSSHIQQHGIPPIRPYQRSHTSQTVISEPFVTVTPELNNRPPRRRRRPPFSYSSLIAQAILDSPDRRLTLREVYQWIMERYPQLYKADDTGWQNTIRHNLSLNKCFKKVPRSDTELGHSTSSSAASKGKGGYWTIDPEYMSAYHDGVFARGGVQKRRPGEVGIHTGINNPGMGDDDSAGSDTSPSDSLGGRLVDVDDESENGFPYHRINHHNGTIGVSNERIPPLQLSIPPPSSSSSASSLMTPPPTASSIISNKPKKILYNNNKRHSSESNFSSMGSPSQSPSGFSNSSGTSGRYDVFHITDFSDVNNLTHYSNNNKNGGSGPEWNSNDSSSIKRESINMDIDQKEEVHSSSPFYYGGQPMERNGSRNVTEQPLLMKRDGDSPYQSIKREDEESNSSMKIRDLLN